MSTEIKQRCNVCETIQEPLGFKHKGWITFKRIDILYSTGEAYFRQDLGNMDFCSLKCFKKWLEKSV